MKIAITLTGQLRDYNKTLPSIINFCNNFNIDIFLLIDNKESKNDVYNVINLTKPKNVKYIDSLDDCGNINMWYKIKKGYEQIKNYEHINNFKYDFYIRCRYDLLIRDYNININFNKLDKNILYFGEKNYNLIPISKYADYFMDCNSDEFFISGEKNMNIYCNFYDILINSNNRCLEHHTSENQLYYFINFNYTKTKFLNIKYRWACFSDIECIKYHRLKDKKNIYKGGTNTVIKKFINYLRDFIIAVLFTYLFIRLNNKTFCKI